MIKEKGPHHYGRMYDRTQSLCSKIQKNMEMSTNNRKNWGILREKLFLDRSSIILFCVGGLWNYAVSFYTKNELFHQLHITYESRRSKITLAEKMASVCNNWRETSFSPTNWGKFIIGQKIIDF